MLGQPLCSLIAKDSTMNASYFDFPSEAVAAQPVSPVKMEDVDPTYLHEANDFMNVQPVSPVKLEEDLEPLSYTDSWHSVPIKMEDIEEETQHETPIKIEDIDPLPLYHLPADLMEDDVADILPDVLDTLQANDLQERLDKAHEEIEQLQIAQQQNRSMIRQLANGVLHEQDNREWYIQQALEEERANQQQVVNDILFSSHQGANFFPEQLVRQDDGSIANLLLMEKLGEGGFGSVHRSVRANENGQHVPCALKIVDADNEEIRHEAEILKKLNHENIIQCYGTILDGPNRKVGIVLELGAMDLVSRQEEYGISPLELREISIGVLKALRYLHSQGISHMDLKPENVMVMSEVGCTLEHYDVKLCDFGLALSSGKRTGPLGTLCYVAPEMAFATPYDTALADMWSFGATMMEVLFDGFSNVWAESYDLFRERNDPHRQGFINGLQYCIGTLSSDYERSMTSEERPCLELIKQLLRVNPQERLSAKDALVQNSSWLGQH